LLIADVYLHELAAKACAKRQAAAGTFDQVKMHWLAWLD
jgi:hypothetical protein